MSYSYDAFDNVLTETEPQGTVTYQYDLAGRRTRMEWPDAEAVVYDWYGGPDLITIGVAGTYNYTVATFVYDSLGRRTGMGGGNGAQSLYSYDDQSALATLTINPWNTADDQTASFTRDAGTRIIGRSGTNSAYDWSPGSASPTTYASNGLNQTTNAGGVSLSYDDRGNMTARGSTTYGYDIANHLTSMAVSGTPTASLSYDPVGRLWEVAGAATTRFLYDGADLIAEYDTSGNVLRRYIHGPGTDEPLIWFEGSATNGIQTLHADERGSVTTVATGSAAAIDINTYDAYGARSSTNPTYASRFGFTGQEWLSDLGLYYYKARMYSPEFGRFLQTDPVGYGDGMNIYAYVGNDPVNRTDPTGMSCVDVNTDLVVSCSDYTSLVNGRECQEEYDVCVRDCFLLCSTVADDGEPVGPTNNKTPSAVPHLKLKVEGACRVNPVAAAALADPAVLLEINQMMFMALNYDRRKVGYGTAEFGFVYNSQSGMSGHLFTSGHKTHIELTAYRNSEDKPYDFGGVPNNPFDILFHSHQYLDPPRPISLRDPGAAALLGLTVASVDVEGLVDCVDGRRK